MRGPLRDRGVRQVTGVGPITALTFVLTVEDPSRFPTPRGGSLPRARAAAARVRRARAAARHRQERRRGPAAAAVQAAHYILGPFGPDTTCVAGVYAGTGARNAKKRARGCREAIGGALRAVEDRRGLRAAAKRHGPRGRVSHDAEHGRLRSAACPTEDVRQLAAPPGSAFMHRPLRGPSKSADRSAAQAPLPDITSGSQRPGGAPYSEDGRHVGLAERPSLIEAAERTRADRGDTG